MKVRQEKGPPSPWQESFPYRGIIVMMPRDAAISQVSAGGIIFRPGPDGPEIALVLDRHGVWTLPKGKVEPGETLTQAALREVAEEVGLSGLEVLEEIGCSRYRFRVKAGVVDKTVHLFLLAASEQAQLHPFPSEGIQQADWFPPDQALKLIGYRDGRRILRRALEQLARRGGTEIPLARERAR